MTRSARLAWIAAAALLAVDGPAAPPSSAAARPEAPAAAAEVEVRRTRMQGSALAGRRRPVSGATVLIRPAERTTRWFVTSTDGRGQFRVDDLADGRYRVVVAREGYVPVIKDEVEVRSPFRAVVEVLLTAADAADAPSAAPQAEAGDRSEMTASVRDRDGEPLPDVRLRLVRVGGGADPRLARTDERGGVRLGGLPRGLWRLELAGVGFLPIRAELELRGETELNVTLVRQPADYRPSPLELMPPEMPVVPDALRSALAGEG